jgi:hypothetical protein
MLLQMKPILTSRTLWSNAVGLLALLLAASGIPADVLGDTGKIVDAILQITAGASFLASTLFRVLATRKLV